MADLLVKKEPTARINVERGANALFYLSLAAFFLSIAIYGGLILLNKSQTKAQAELTNQVQIKEQDLRPELINQIFLLDKRIRNIRGLLAGHIFPSNVLQLIEMDTHPQVSFDNFALSTDSKRIDLTGETVSYAVLSKQIALLENDPQISQVEFGGLSFGSANLLGFKLTLVFKPSLIQTRPE